jgi:hypothetical protein
LQGTPKERELEECSNDYVLQKNDSCIILEKRINDDVEDSKFGYV